MAGIYVHIPFCRHKCSYCDFTSFPDKVDYAEAYMACVYREMKMRGEELKDYTFDTVYFGGGTPSYIPPKLILGAMNRIRECFKLTKDAGNYAGTQPWYDCGRESEYLFTGRH